MDDFKLANLFLINEQQYAIAIENIIRIVRAVEITAVPQSPLYIYGVIDYHGQVIPVINIRHCLGIEPKELSTDDRFMILQTPKRIVAIVADEVTDIISLENLKEIESTFMADKMDFGSIIRLESGIVFIYNLEKLISEEQESEITNMLNAINK